MEHQDWKTVKWYKSSGERSSRKKTSNPSGTKKFRSLDSEEPPAPVRVSHNLQMAIQKARCAKKMTQKQLANSMNIQVSVINDYESGKAVPNRQILSKLGRKLGVKLN